jgi:hypothetical protein
LKNWKTSLCGILIAIPQLLVAVWPDCPKEVMGVVSSLAALVGFYIAKDKNVTGGTVSQ